MSKAFLLFASNVLKSSKFKVFFECPIELKIFSVMLEGSRSSSSVFDVISAMPWTTQSISCFDTTPSPSVS
ncbi:hypothetical protein HK407_04g07240 [Ordospora pajunii]|uniref:uncharacterized protein n=1 Tax=Ordospora pajunii TaxID=3039483 RepID=UPI0029526D7D|nr:uncharacterized protein HK407_04g07240 [Ordospora pajunii]KAH9411617.1 hypothetical protein HK407_04g07240 [Ordospora pajunii]